MKSRLGGGYNRANETPDVSRMTNGMVDWALSFLLAIRSHARDRQYGTASSVIFGAQPASIATLEWQPTLFSLPLR